MVRKLIPPLTGRRKINTREIPYTPVAAEYNEVLEELNRHFNSISVYADDNVALLDFSNALTYKVSLQSNTLFSAMGARENDTMMIQISQGATYTAAFPSEFHFVDGSAPTITATTGAIDLVSAYYNGTNYLCSIIQDVKVTT